MNLSINLEPANCRTVSFMQAHPDEVLSKILSTIALDLQNTYSVNAFSLRNGILSCKIGFTYERMRIYNQNKMMRW